MTQPDSSARYGESFASWGIPAAVIAGAISAVAGVLVLAGWHWHVSSLVQIAPSFAPMQYNTALAFLSCGLGLVALALGRLRLAACLAALGSLIGALTLIEYGFRIDLGIDRLFMEPYITVKTSHPGRMAPNTAVGFVLFGASLAAACGARRSGRTPTIAGLLGLCVFSLGLASLLAYLGGLETVDGWGELTRMAVHTAANFLVLGSGVLAWFYGGAVSKKTAHSPWIPGFMALSCLLVTLMLCGGLVGQEKAQLEVALKTRSEHLADEITLAVDESRDAIARMALRWQVRGGTPRKEWHEDALAYLSHRSAFETIQWIDSSWNRRWLVSQAERQSHGKEGLDVLQARWRKGQKRGETTAFISDLWPLGDGGQAFSVFAPIESEKGFNGGIAAAIRLERLVESLFADEAEQGFGFRIENDRGIVYGPPDPLHKDEAAHSQIHDFELDGLSWRLRVWPGTELLNQFHSRLAGLMLVGGFLASVILGIAVRTAQVSRLRATEIQEVNEELKAEIEERGRAEARLQKLAETLEQKVADRTRALADQRTAALNMMKDAQEARGMAERAEEEIGKKNQELETLLYVTSHDLREPLRAIENFSRLVHDRYSDGLCEKAADYLERVVKAAVRMETLLDDILALSRIRRIGEAKEEVDMGEIVQAALERLEGALQRTGASVLVHPDLPRLRVDPTWATQAVYNLIANALKFTQDGKAPEIEIAPFRPAPGEQIGSGIIVGDRGPGVAPEYAERIFQLFQRAVGREIEGTGAGLAIVRGIAQRHGGRAWTRPRKGGGAEFIITFGEIHQGGER